MKPYRVMEIGRGPARRFIASHYLHCWPGVTVAIVGLLDGWTPIGCAVFALPPRETKVRYGGTCWELARLFIEDGTPKNTESWFLSRCVKWLRSAHPEVKCLVSYADPSAGHRGTIYEAANWIPDGFTDQERKTPRFDYEHKGKKYSRRSHVPEGVAVQRVARISKRRFVYWLDGQHEKRRASAQKLALA